MKPVKLIVGSLLIFGSAALGLSAFQKSLTPYVSFKEAKAAGSSVQVSGEILRSQVAYNAMDGTLRFPLKDHTGEVMHVVFEGGKPNNFDQAESVVAIGKCENGTFHAASLLTKCPSKYEAEPGAAPQRPGGPGMTPVQKASYQTPGAVPAGGN